MRPKSWCRYRKEVYDGYTSLNEALHNLHSLDCKVKLHYVDSETLTNKTVKNAGVDAVLTMVVLGNAV